MKKNNLPVVAWVAILTLALSPLSKPSILASSTGFIYTEGEALMLDGEQFIIKGYNYYPRDYAWTSLSR
jgi:hypothetical protein